MSVLTSATLTRAVTELPSVAKLIAGATAFILNYLTNVVYFILLSLLTNVVYFILNYLTNVVYFILLSLLTNVVYFILLSLPDQCSLLYSTFSTSV